MPWGSNITQVAAPAAPYQGQTENFYKIGAGERKKEFDLKVAEARARVRAQFIAPKLEALKTALKQAETELASLEAEKTQNEKSATDMSPFEAAVPPLPNETPQPRVFDASVNGVGNKYNRVGPSTFQQEGEPAQPNFNDYSTGEGLDQLNANQMDARLADRSLFDQGGGFQTAPYNPAPTPSTDFRGDPSMTGGTAAPAPALNTPLPIPSLYSGTGQQNYLNALEEHKRTMAQAPLFGTRK